LKNLDSFSSSEAIASNANLLFFLSRCVRQSFDFHMQPGKLPRVTPPTMALLFSPVISGQCDVKKIFPALND